MTLCGQVLAHTQAFPCFSMHAKIKSGAQIGSPNHLSGALRGVTCNYQTTLNTIKILELEQTTVVLSPSNIYTLHVNCCDIICIVLGTFQAHHMAVHAIRWNPFHQNVFASCGADWAVKIWDHTRKLVHLTKRS